MKAPYYVFEHIVEPWRLRSEPGASASEPYWRVIVWDDFKMPSLILGVAEHEDREVLQDFVRDNHSEAKSLETLKHERA